MSKMHDLISQSDSAYSTPTLTHSKDISLHLDINNIVIPVEMLHTV